MCRSTNYIQWPTPPSTDNNGIVNDLHQMLDVILSLRPIDGEKVNLQFRRVRIDANTIIDVPVVHGCVHWENNQERLGYRERLAEGLRGRLSP